MSFLHITRRTHLYLGLFLLPWFFVYGVSSVPFSHGPWIREKFYNDGTPEWRVRFERPYHIEIPSQGELRSVGAQVLKDSGVEEGAFGAFRERDGRLTVYRHDFWRSTRIVYDPDRKTLKAEDKRFRFDQFLTGIHARGGFEQTSLLDNLWGVVVDLVCLAIVVWIASGLVMWWQLPGHRLWGAIALGSGLGAFLMFLVAL